MFYMQNKIKNFEFHLLRMTAEFQQGCGIQAVKNKDA